jgi:hypothetical protein
MILYYGHGRAGTGMFTRLRKKWKVYENIIQLLVGVFGVWKEKSD